MAIFRLAASLLICSVQDELADTAAFGIGIGVGVLGMEEATVLLFLFRLNIFHIMLGMSCLCSGLLMEINTN